MSFVDESGSVASALMAAVFWFRSATKPPPPTYEGMEQFPAWAQATAKNNQWAAGSAGVSALLAALATLKAL